MSACREEGGRGAGGEPRVAPGGIRSSPRARSGLGRPEPGGSALPVCLSSFVGREDACEDVVRAVNASRLVTLTGPGGAGKTRLGLEVAADLREGGSPLTFVDLAPLSGPGSVLPAVAAEVGVGADPGRSLFEALVAHLGEVDLLVVLDNCEQVRADCAHAAAALLGACGGLRILATSRQRLGVAGEVVWPVPPLSLPEPGPAALPEAFVDSEAVRLFCERAAALQPGFLPTHDNLEAIVEICRCLDGSPLAIELAAARVVALPPAEIAARLDDRFALLGGGPSTAPSRHRTLRAALDWSYQLLSLPQRVLLRKLSVFRGGFGLDGAERVCGGGDVEPGQVLESLTGLVDKSLVVSEPNGGSARFRLLETVRAYAAERLDEAGTTAALAERHAAWCLALAEQAGGPGSGCGADWVQRLEVEHDNLRAALEWALASGRAELALRLVKGQTRLWERRGRFAEARTGLERVLAATEAAPAALRASVLHDAGYAALMAGAPDAAQRHLQASLALSTQASDPAAAVRTRALLARASVSAGAAGREHLEQAVAEARGVGDDSVLAEVLAHCCQARMLRGEPSTARGHCAGSLQAARRAGDRSLQAASLVGLGSAELVQGDYPAADDHLQQSVALAAASGDTYRQVLAKTWLAELAHLRGDHDTARKRFEECLSRARAMGAPHPLARSLLGLGRVLLEGGDAEGALPLFDQAATVAHSAGVGHLASRALTARGQAASALGDDARARADLDGAVSLARRSADKTGEALALAGLAHLTQGEGDVTGATTRYGQALALQVEVGDPAAIASCLDSLGTLAGLHDDLSVAACLMGAGDALRRRHGCARSDPQQQVHTATIEAVRQALGESPFAAEWHRGEAMSIGAAVVCAEALTGRRVPRPSTGWEALTEGERRVAEQAAQGHTNAQIARKLGIAQATVKAHLRSVFAKLGVQTRASLAAQAPRPSNPGPK